MAHSDDDEDLKRAIAMSLEEPTNNAHPEVIELGSSDNEEDEDLRRALALSLEDKEVQCPSSSGFAAGSTSSQHAYATPPSSNPSSQRSLEPNRSVSQAPSSIFNLDRRTMEQERLARLGKRKRSGSPVQVSKLAKASSIAPTEGKATPDVGNEKENASIRYPRGIIKRTWAVRHTRENDIKIEEVFQASTLNIAVISAFQSEDKWIFSKISPEKIKQIWIMSAKEDDLQEKLISEVADARIPNLKLCFPPLLGQAQNVHSKLMLLFHDTHLRVVIPTANMTKVDWGETGNTWQPGVLENSVFLIDLPRRADRLIGEKSDLSQFGKGLMDLVEAQGLQKLVLEGILKFDFSATEHIAFVHSIPGSLTERYADNTGLRGLSSALRNLGLDGVDEIELDYASSSLGAIKESFLLQLYQAARGKVLPTKEVGPTDLLDRIRIYFPSRETVEKSTGGPDCGGIITLSRKDFSNAFPKGCMRDYRSKRPGILSHNKVLLARGRKRDGTPVAWAYIGSANLSESAWGSQRVLKSGNDGKFNVRNWECGVVVPVSADTLNKTKLEKGEVPPMSVFKDTLDVPFEHPGEVYGKKEPWFYRS